VVWVLEDARSLPQSGRSQREYQNLALVGKSIGTLAMAMLIAQILLYDWLQRSG
jgi:hypothetical protein